MLLTLPRLILLLYIVTRIIQVDLKFPPKPIVSSAAKDLISQVLHLFHALWIFFLWTSLENSLSWFILLKHFFLSVFSFSSFKLTDAGQGFLWTTTVAQTPRTPLDCSECRALRYIQELVCLANYFLFLMEITRIAASSK